VEFIAVCFKPLHNFHTIISLFFISFYHISFYSQPVVLSHSRSHRWPYQLQQHIVQLQAAYTQYIVYVNGNYNMNTVISKYKKYIPQMLLIVLFLFCQSMSELTFPSYMSDIFNKSLVKNDQTYILYNGLIVVLRMAIFALIMGVGTLINAIPLSPGLT